VLTIHLLSTLNWSQIIQEVYQDEGVVSAQVTVLVQQSLPVVTDGFYAFINSMNETDPHISFFFCLMQSALDSTLYKGVSSEREQS